MSLDVWLHQKATDKVTNGMLIYLQGMESNFRDFGFKQENLNFQQNETQKSFASRQRLHFCLFKMQKS